MKRLHKRLLHSLDSPVEEVLDILESIAAIPTLTRKQREDVDFVRGAYRTRRMGLEWPVVEAQGPIGEEKWGVGLHERRRHAIGDATVSALLTAAPWYADHHLWCCLVALLPIHLGDLCRLLPRFPVQSLWRTMLCGDP